MTVVLYDCDRSEVRARILSETAEVGALPRRTIYGAAPDLIPFGEQYPDKLVQPTDYKKVIAQCHEQQIFPLYHQRAAWAPPGFRWMQNGLNLCWAWSAVAALMDLLAREGKPVPLLSPVTLGWLVNWNNRGNYLESAIKGLMQRGVAEMKYTPNQHSLRYRDYEEGWESNAMQYRLGEVWDADNGSTAKMIQHSISILKTGTPMPIAYNWEGHALELCGVRWDERQVNNLVWQIRNSHNEADIIERVGKKAVPDEGYGYRATLT